MKQNHEQIQDAKNQFIHHLVLYNLLTREVCIENLIPYVSVYAW